MNRLRGRFPVRKWIAGKGEFTGSWLEQRPDFSIVESQETYATGVKLAKTRWNAKPRDCATPFRHPESPVCNAARQPVGWADTARFELPDQSVHAKSLGTADPESECTGSPSPSVRRSEADILEHSARAASIRDTH